jgi:hypothetical protein
MAVVTCRGVLNKLLPDVYIYTDHVKGPESGLSPGFGVTLVAESTSGCLASAESCTGAGETPEELGARVASLLCDEVSRGGCVDTNLVPMFLVFMALTPEDVSRVRVGKLSPRAISVLRLLRDLVGVRFRLRPEPKGTLRKRASGGPAVTDAAATALLAGRGMSSELAAAAASHSMKKSSDDPMASLSRGKRSRDDVEAEEDDEDLKEAEAAAALAARVEVAATDSVVLSCVGSGFKNMARAVT